MSQECASSSGSGGGEFSTPFDATGAVRGTWATNLVYFFNDLKRYGIQRVTPTPVIAETWSGNFVLQSGTTPEPEACSPQTKQLLFAPWLPFGLDPANNNYADGQGNNQAYRCSPVNPRFWGWDKFFNLFDKILEKAQSVGLELHEFDLANEVNLQDFTVSARLIYDNVSSTPVFQRLDSMMIQRGFARDAPRCQ